MKRIQYKIAKTYNNGVEENQTVISEYCPENLALAKERAYNGEITIEDDSLPKPEPTELERLRADLDFISVMTGVIL